MSLLSVSETQRNHYDVAVVGAGPGGYVTAIRLAQYGKRVVIIEKDKLGGTCLNWGCIPSKALIHAANLYQEISHASQMGIEVEGTVRLNAETLQQWKGTVVAKLNGGIRQLLKSHQITSMKGMARFIDVHTLEVVSEAEDTEPSHVRQVSADYILIATGSTPIELPHLKLDGQTLVSSTEALSWTSVPKLLAVIGGGVIGLELGVMYQKLGAEVTVIEMLPQLLPGTDKDVVQALTRALKKRGMKLKLSTKVTEATVTDEGCTLTIEPEGKASETLAVDKVLVAIGRKPNTTGLNLDTCGITLGERGFIPVDAQCRTTQPHIFAIGDVVEGPALAHKASTEGLVVAEVICGKPEVVDYKAMPAAVFTDPEVATVGLSEAQAREQGFEVKIGIFPLQASGRALTMNQAEGLVKMVCDAATEQVLGVHMVGPHVAELLGEATLAIEMGATAADLALTVHTHPTLSESLMEAAEAIHQKAIHLYVPPAKPAAAMAGAGA